MMAENNPVEEATPAHENNSKFVKHLKSIPVVDSTWVQLSAYYAMAKDYNRVLRFGLTTAESGAMKVLHTAQPMLDKYQDQITKVDNFASDQLTKIEEKYPVIKKTPEELVAGGKEIYSHYVQPAVDKVNSVKEFSCSTLNSMKQLGLHETGKEFGKKQMQKATEFTQSQLMWLLQTDYGQQLLHQVEMYLSMSEDAVDKYLPPAEDENVDESKREMNMARVGTLSKTITRRVYSKAIKDLRNVHANTKEAVEKLLASVGLIETVQNNYDSTKQTIQNLREKLVSTWSDITSEEDPSVGKPDEEKTNHDLAITLLRRLTHQVKETVNKIHSTMPETPAVVKQLAEESYHYTESLYNEVKQAKNFQEVSTVLYSKSAESVLGLQQVLQTLINTPMSYVQKLPTTELEMEPVTSFEKSEPSLSESQESTSSVEKGTEERKMEEKETDDSSITKENNSS